jgi:hypothetical protein
VQDKREFTVEAQQEVLGATFDAEHAATSDEGGQGRVDGPAQPALVQRKHVHMTAGNVRRDAAPRGFDFRKLGQRTPRLV